MLPILQIGPLAIQTPGLFLLAGLWLGLNLSERFAGQRGVPPNKLYNLVFSGLIGGIVGGRLVYAIRYPAAFSQNPIGLLSINPGLLDFEAGTLMGAIAAWIYGYRNLLRPWPTLDALTPMFASVAIAVGLAHLASGAAFGQPTVLPWGIELWGVTRHPTQIYESALAALIMVILWPSRQVIRSWQPGRYFLAFAASGSCARLFVEAFRGDSLLLPGGYRLEQVIAWMILIASLIGLQKITPDSPAADHELHDDVPIES